MAVDAAAIEIHKDHLRRMSGPGGPLVANGPNATIANPAWFVTLPGGKPRLTPERAAVHAEILREFAAAKPNVDAERTCIVLAGPSGAGKSTTLDRLLPPDKQERWRRVDADHFKEVLLTRAMQDGSYESHLKPQEVKDLEAQGEKFFPLELAALVHEESSMLARRARDTAIENGENLVVDTVLSKPDAALALGAQLEVAGYRIEVVDVEVSFEVSAERIASRWERDYVKGIESGDSNHLGGRWVPSEYPRHLFVEGESESRSAQSARLLAEKCGAVVGYRVFEPVGEKAEAVRMSGRTHVGAPLLSGDALRAARVAAGGISGQVGRPTAERAGPESPGHER